jgi:DNA-binding NarL/FixJ family response regulator
MLESLPTEYQGHACGRSAFHYLGTSLSAIDSSCRSTAKSKGRTKVETSRAWADLGAQTRVLVAHASPIVAAGLRATFTTMPGVAGVHLSENPLAEMLNGQASDRVLVFADYRTAVAMMHALDADASPNVAVVCVTDRDKEIEIRGALSVGISGYLLADCGLDDYVECLKVLSAGAKYVCSGALRRLAERQQLSGLTPRELNVLRLVIDGRSNQAIGQELQLALGTIKAHVRAILTKLGAKSRTQAACLAAERGIYGAVMAA